MKSVEVKTGGSAYTVRIGPGLLGQIGLHLQEYGFNGSLVLVTNPVVKRLWGKAVEDSLRHAGFTVTVLDVPDGEQYKSLVMAGSLYRKLNRALAERTTPILSLGGGVIGDLAGFVAATYMRGVPLVHLPTTLLAQVDSSIGGKVAVNHGSLKNNIGVFYHPRLVVSDIAALKTLEEREFNNGMAEVIKSALVWSEEFFIYLEKNLDKVKARDEATLEEVICRAARIKAEVVARDEKDMGLRNILNYGHTIGHAIESALAFQLPHGSAVAIGMLAAGRISNQLGVLSRSGMARVSSLI
ncbi:MAG: 3-dehydroquinate synthase, partial [Chloroflexi bacterium]|nr:3-dehydroquinate synthase [Chloroflexota bacterium]